MKYLLNKNLKAIACGESIEAGEGEIVFDPEGTHKLAELKAVALANKVEHPAKIKMVDLAALIYAHFANLDLKETINIKSIVIEGVEAGKSDDDIMMELVNAGIHFRDVVGQFRTAMMAAGYILKPAERNAKLAELLKDFAPESGPDVTDMIELMQSEIPRTTERQAMAAIRKYAKENDIELPKVNRPTGFKKKLFTWMIENPAASQDDLAEYVKAHNKPESVTRRYSEVLTLARKMAMNMPIE